MAKGDIQGEYDQWSMVMLYEPHSGAILHTHQVVSSRGGVHPDAHALEKQAVEHASRARKVSLQNVAFLHVDPRDVDFHALYRVDLKAKSLVLVEPAKG